MIRALHHQYRIACTSHHKSWIVATTQHSVVHMPHLRCLQLIHTSTADLAVGGRHTSSLHRISSSASSPANSVIPTHHIHAHSQQWTHSSTVGGGQLFIHTLVRPADGRSSLRRTQPCPRATETAPVRRPLHPPEAAQIWLVHECVLSSSCILHAACWTAC